MAGLSAWIISDDKMGNLVQGRGVADALGLAYEVKTVAPRGMARLLAPWGDVARSERFGETGAPFAAPWPDVAIAIGRSSIPYIKALGKLAGPQTFRIILLDPKVNAKHADVIWVPRHDRRRGANVITTLTAPHSFTPARIAAIRSVMPAAIAALPRPRVAIILGGRTPAYKFTDADHARFATALRTLAQTGTQSGAQTGAASGTHSRPGFMITPSRRTHDDLLTAVLNATAEAPRLVYKGEGANPYADYLCCADALIVSADSVNMTGEAVATGRPVYVFEPSGGSAKFNRFHQALRSYGATRALPDELYQIEPWTYEPLDSAADIARQIEARWQQSRAAAAP